MYYPQTLSALDISSGLAADESSKEEAYLDWLQQQGQFDGIRQAANSIKGWERITTLYDNLAKDGARRFGIPEDRATKLLVDAVNNGAGGEAVAAAPNTRDRSQHGILKGEWPLLCRTAVTDSKFLRIRPARAEQEWPEALSRVWDHIALVDRLREVRALIGFRRVKPDSTSDLVAVDLGNGVPWLPGTETFGEGIFLRFSEKFLRSWEEGLPQHVLRHYPSLVEKCARWGREPAPVYASARFIALHTFAHGLIRRLAFDAGYSSSSLRERIYCDHPPTAQAGIMIYTSDSDSEGSLGGLVRQGSPQRLLGSVQRTLADLSWCSGDPVCSELSRQGLDGMNAAACHACCLVSETSCVFNNTLLDRRLVIGSLDGAIPGLLAHLASTAG